MPTLRFLALLAVAHMVPLNTVSAAEIFVYQKPDGSRLITDHARLEPAYALIKVYSNLVEDDPIYAATAATATRSTEFDGLIRKVSDSMMLDPALIKSVMHAESAFNPNALSKKGARGLMQLMPGTAERYGVTRILDPQQNVLAGGRYLRDLLRQFNGDMRLALAGYNAGENAVLKYGGIPPYAETQHYVRKVMELYKGYRNLNCDNAPSGVKIISCSSSSKKNGRSTAWVSTVQ